MFEWTTIVSPLFPGTKGLHDTLPMFGSAQMFEIKVTIKQDFYCKSFENNFDFRVQIPHSEGASAYYLRRAHVLLAQMLHFHAYIQYMQEQHRKDRGQEGATMQHQPFSRHDGNTSFHGSSTECCT